MEGPGAGSESKSENPAYFPKDSCSDGRTRRRLRNQKHESSLLFHVGKDGVFNVEVVDVAYFVEDFVDF